jgi:hypothetical protein
MKVRKNTRRAGQGSVYQCNDGRWGWAITYGYNSALHKNAKNEFWQVFAITAL